jgi:hypothetical protein
LNALSKILKKLKKSFGTDKSRAFYIIGGLLFFVALGLISLLPNWPIFSGSLLLLASFLLMIGFLIWHIPLMSKIWMHEHGKIAVSIAHIFILLLTTVLARNLLTQSLGLPGKDFQLSLSLLTLILYLPVWLAVVSIVFGIGFYILGLITNQKSTASRYIGHALGSSGTLIVLYFIFLIASRSEGLQSLVRILAFYSDYESASNYPETRPNERINFHENGVISTAWHTNGDVVISVKKFESK